MRAIIEMKWPLIRKGIIKKLFIPYLAFLLTFLFYSVFIFENLNPHPEWVPEEPLPEVIIIDESANAT